MMIRRRTFIVGGGAFACSSLLHLDKRGRIIAVDDAYGGWQWLLVPVVSALIDYSVKGILGWIERKLVSEGSWDPGTTVSSRSAGSSGVAFTPVRADEGAFKSAAQGSVQLAPSHPVVYMPARNSIKRPLLLQPAKEVEAATNRWILMSGPPEKSRVYRTNEKMADMILDPSNCIDYPIGHTTVGHCPTCRIPQFQQNVRLKDQTLKNIGLSDKSDMDRYRAHLNHAPRFYGCGENQIIPGDVLEECKRTPIVND